MTTTNFFSQMAETLKNANLDITLSMKKDTVSVMITPKMKTGSDEIPPVIISGTIAELDEGFFPLFLDKSKKIAGVISNIEEYDKLISAVEKAKKEKLDEKMNKKKPATPKPAATSVATVDNEEEDEEENDDDNEEAVTETVKETKKVEPPPPSAQPALF